MIQELMVVTTIKPQLIQAIGYQIDHLHWYGFDEWNKCIWIWFKLENYRIIDNIATHDGAGIHLEHSNVQIFNSHISNNESYNNGGGFFSYYSTINFTHSLITNNTAFDAGGAFSLRNPHETNIINATIYGNLQNRGIIQLEQENSQILN